MKLKYNDEEHAYWLDGKRCKGVSSLAKQLESTFALEQWQMRMVAIGMAKTPALVEAVAVNFDDKDEMRRLVEKAKDAAGSFVAQDRGTTLHRVTERHDLGLALIDTDINTRIRDAWQAGLDRAGLEVDPRWVERIVVYPTWKIAGRFDRYLRRKTDGKLVVADTKSGQKAVQYPHPIAIQLAFYANAPLIAAAINGSGETTEFEARPDIDLEVGYTIHMPTDDYAEIVEFDIAAGWQTIQNILIPVLEWRDRKNLARVHTAPLADLLEQSCPTPEPTPNASSSSTVPASSSTTGPHPPTGTPPDPNPTPGTTNPSTTSTAAATDLKTRLNRIKNEHPDLYRLILNRWPAPGLRYHELNPTEHTAVLALVDELDIEGPRVESADIQLAAEKYAALTDEQRERILAWARECEDNSFRAFGVGGGNHTTRRLCLLETCIAVAQEGIDDNTFGTLLGDSLPPGIREFRPIGHTLGHMNWRQAQALWAGLRAYMAGQP